MPYMKGLQGKVSFLILFSILFSIPLQASFAQTTSGTDETSDDLLQSFFKLFSDFIKLFTDQEQDDILDELESIVETSRDTGATGVQQFGEDVEMGSGSATYTGATEYTGVEVIAKDTIGLSDGASATTVTKGDNGETGGDGSSSGDSGSESGDSSSESGDSSSESGGSGSGSGGSGSSSGSGGSGSGSGSGGSGSS